MIGGPDELVPQTSQLAGGNDHVAAARRRIRSKSKGIVPDASVTINALVNKFVAGRLRRVRKGTNSYHGERPSSAHEVNSAVVDFLADHGMSRA